MSTAVGTSKPIVTHDFRDYDGMGYRIERADDGAYRWVWSDECDSDTAGRGPFDNAAEALCAAADDWEQHCDPDGPAEWERVLRAAATRLRSAVQTSEGATR